MAHFLGTPSRSRLWWTSAHDCYGMEEAKKLHKRLLAGPTVDIYVGPERKHWTLHRNLLCHHSSYFETEFEGHEVPKGMKQDGNKLELPNDDPIGFELLVKWLYQGHLEDCLGETDEQKYEHAVACYKLHLLCDKLDMIMLKNLAMDLYRQALHEAQLVPDAGEIDEIYRCTPPGSPFRRLVTKIAARQIMDNGTQKDAETYRKCFENDPRFAVEMINAIRSTSSGMLFADPTRAIDACQYHDHSDGSTCADAGKPSAHVIARSSSKSSVTRGTCFLTAIAASDTGSQQAVKDSPVVPKRLVVELSAEKRTPRKLHVQQPSSPTPKIAKQTQPLTNGHTLPPPRTRSPDAKSSGQSNSDKPASKHSRKNTPKQTSGSTVLGKRRSARGSLDSINQAPVRSNTVNGIVQHLNGASRPNAGSESSQSQAGASESPARKAPPKLRRPSLVNGD